MTARRRADVVINPKCLGKRLGSHVLEVMDDAERTDVLIRRNRYLLAKAAEVRRMVRGAEERAAETCLAIAYARIEGARRQEFRDQRQSTDLLLTTAHTAT